MANSSQYRKCAARSTVILLALCALTRPLAAASRTSGKAYFRHLNANDWSELGENYSPADGDKIRIESDSTSSIDLGGGVTAELGPNSLFAVKKLQGSVKSIVLALGSIKVSSAKDSAAAIKLRTPAAFCSGKNVEFTAELDTQGAASFAVANGRLSITDNSGSETTLRKGESAVLAAANSSDIQAAADFSSQSPEAPPAAEAASSLPTAAAAKSTGPITFTDILHNPDDTDLSYRYALAQVKQGDLRGAVSALERVLLIDPNQHKIRLLYAIILYRLDSLNESERELNTLVAMPIAPSLRAEIDEYKKNIQRRKRHVHASGTLSIAFDYDSNRNATPSSDLRLILNTLVPVAGAGLKKQDTGGIGIGTVRLSRDFGQAAHEIFVSGTYFRDQQNVVRTGDIQAYSWQGGAVIKTPFAKFTPYAAFDNVRLVQETFLRTQGGGLRAEQKLSNRLSVNAEGKLSYQEFLRTAIVPVGPERSGRQGSIALGASYALAPTFGVTLGYGWTRKDAVQRYDGYDRNSVNAGSVWILGKGCFLSASLVADYDRYFGPDALIDNSVKRRDDSYRMRVTLGIPLSVISKSLKSLTLTESYEYFRDYSNIINYSYDNNKEETMLMYRWEL